jgi:hypothetical protein
MGELNCYGSPFNDKHSTHTPHATGMMVGTWSISSKSFPDQHLVLGELFPWKLKLKPSHRPRHSFASITKINNKEAKCKPFADNRNDVRLFLYN